MDPFFKEAINQAKKSLAEGGIPIGSVLVFDNKIIGKGHNKRIQDGSVIRHGEMDALENAGRQAAKVYKNATLYTTLSPCHMCSGAILLYGIKQVVIGENHTFLGAEQLLKDHDVHLTILQDEECIQLMTLFIKDNPSLWNEDIGEPS